MNKFLNFVLIAAALGLAFPAAAQRVNSSGGNSPHETTGAVIDGCRVTITYGRPYMKGRTVWGGQLAPWGKAWRMGSDEATTLITQQPLAFGDVTIPAGAYTLYMVPGENGSKLAISKTLGGWGIPVDEKNDLARVDLKKEAVSAPVEQFTMAVKRNSGGGGLITLSWDNAQYSAAFTVKK